MPAVKAEKVDVSANVIRNYVETLSHAVLLPLKFLTIWLTSFLPRCPFVVVIVVVVCFVFFSKKVNCSITKKQLKSRLIPSFEKKNVFFESNTIDRLSRESL